MWEIDGTIRALPKCTVEGSVEVGGSIADELLWCNEVLALVPNVDMNSGSIEEAFSKVSIRCVA